MGTTISINGTAYKGLDEFFVAGAVVAGIYYALPPLGNAPEAGQPRYDESRVNIPGRDWTAIVRSGKVALPIWADMVLIDTLANMGAKVKTFLAGLTQLARYTIILPDTSTYLGCRLMQQAPRPVRENISAGYVAVTYHNLCFEQLSDAN